MNIQDIMKNALWITALFGIYMEIIGTWMKHDRPIKLNNLYRVALYAALIGLAWTLGRLGA